MREEEEVGRLGLSYVIIRQRTGHRTLSPASDRLRETGALVLLKSSWTIVGQRLVGLLPAGLAKMGFDKQSDDEHGRPLSMPPLVVIIFQFRLGRIRPEETRASFLEEASKRMKKRKGRRSLRGLVGIIRPSLCWRSVGLFRCGSFIEPLGQPAQVAAKASSQSGSGRRLKVDYSRGEASARVRVPSECMCVASLASGIRPRDFIEKRQDAAVVMCLAGHSTWIFCAPLCLHVDMEVDVDVDVAAAAADL